MQLAEAAKRSEPDSEAEHKNRILDFAVSRSPAIFYVADWDEMPYPTFVSSNVESITGHPVSAFLEDQDFGRSLLHPDDREAYFQAVRDLKTEGQACAEYRYRNSEGEYLWFRDDLRFSPGEGDKTDEVVGCMIDITRQKRAETSFKDAEALKSEIVDAALDAIVVADEDGRILEFNPAAEETFGYARADVLGRRMSELLVPEQHRKKHLKGIKRFVESGASRFANRPIETEGLRADGSIFPIEITLRGVRLEERLYFVAELWDITEQLDARQERRLLAEERSRLSGLLRDALESIPNGIGIYDSARRLVLCNSAYAAPFGREPLDMVATPASEIHREALALVKTWDGHAVDNTEEGVARTLKWLSEADGEPIEVQLQNGEWRQVTSHPTGDGGRVFVRTDITKLKRAEESLRRSEEQFRSIVEGSPMPVRVADLETWEILYESPAAAAIVGRPWPNSEPHATSADYADPEQRNRLIELLVEKGRVDNYEARLTRADGEVFWASLSARVIRYQGKEVSVTSLVDLTERKRREAELQQAYEILEDAIESLAEGFALYDEQDRLVMCNARYLEFNEPSADVLRPGVKWADFIRTGAERGQYVDAVGRVDDWIKERSGRREQETADQVFQQCDGRWFRASNRRTRQGGFVAIRTDITSQIEVEQARREGEALIRKVVEACPLPIIMTRAEDGHIIYESPAHKAMYGRDQASDLRDTAADFYVQQADRQAYLGRLRAKGAVENFEVQLQRTDGETFWAALSGRLIEYQGDEVIVCCPVDLTDRRAVEEEMAQQREALHQSEKLGALGSLLAGVAHELNNPLSVVVGQALLMKETTSDPRIAARAAKIGNAADRCSRIVKTFLAMARQQTSQRSAVSITEIVESTLDVTGYSLRTAGIEVDLDLEAALPPVWADADQLNQVLTNLIVNAQQALAEVEGPRRLIIASGFDRQRDMVTLSVTDSGPGVPAEIRSRIFEPFFTTKEVGAGTGVGLAVCHRIVESLQGKITLDKAPGHGARFTVALPVAAPQRRATPKPAPGPSKARACKVLVIDDESEVTRMLGDILTADGHEVRAADSGRRALELLSRHKFDIILSDLRMPNMDGPRLFTTLSELSPGLIKRVAFITGDTFSPTVSEFLQESGRPYVQKPFTPAEVRDLIAKVGAAFADGEAAD